MKKSGSVFAPVIAACGIGAMLIVGALRATSLADHYKEVLMTVMIAAYIAWILSEFRITTGAASMDAANDRGTCEAYAIGRFLTMLTAIGFDSLWSGPGPWEPIGFLLFFGGIGLRAYAIYSLGRLYSHRVRTPSENTIISSGPYRFLRHPAYAGMLLAHVGVLVLFFNWFLLVAFCCVFVPVLVRRIRVEESHLLAIPAYRTFAAGRARLAPGIW